MKRRLKVLLLFDFPFPPPRDGRYAARMHRQDWRPFAAALRALRSLGHEARPLAVHDRIEPLLDALREWKPEVVLNMADSFRNDRAREADLAGLLELWGVPYTGCPPAALSLCRNKAFVARVLAPLGIHFPRSVVLRRGARAADLANLRFPALVKPLTEEGSEGISTASFVKTPQQALARADYLRRRYRCDALAEEYVEGREIYAPLIGGVRPRLLPLREARFGRLPASRPRIATYQFKWNKPFRRRWGIRAGFAGPLPPRALRQIRAAALTAFRELELRGAARLDLRVTPEGEVYVLEVNPNPGLAPDDELACAARKAGINHAMLLQKLLDWALKRPSASVRTPRGSDRRRTRQPQRNPKSFCMRLTDPGTAG